MCTCLQSVRQVCTSFADSKTRFLSVQIAYNIDVVKTNVPEALEVLADAVLNPRFTTWEVAEAIQKLEKDIQSLKENPQTVLLEVNSQNNNRSLAKHQLQCNSPAALQVTAIVAA